MDGIHPRVLCELKEGVAEPLADFMNKTLGKSELPQEWKDAMVTPIYKKGAKSMCSLQSHREHNQRPGDETFSEQLTPHFQSA